MKLRYPLNCRRARLLLFPPPTPFPSRVQHYSRPSRVVIPHGSKSPSCCVPPPLWHDLVLYLLQVSVTYRFHPSTNSPSSIVHWEAFKEAVRRDGLGAFLHLSQIRDAATAKLFCVTCNFACFIPHCLAYRLTITHSCRFCRIRGYDYNSLACKGR